jgi:hypothetical protein
MPVFGVEENDFSEDTLHAASNARNTGKSADSPIHRMM